MFLLVWGQVSMMNGNFQWNVRARMWTEVREGVRQGHFLTRVVTDDVVIALEVQQHVLQLGWYVCQVLLGDGFQGLVV